MIEESIIYVKACNFYLKQAPSKAIPSLKHPKYLHYQHIAFQIIPTWFMNFSNCKIKSSKSSIPNIIYYLTPQKASIFYFLLKAYVSLQFRLTKIFSPDNILPGISLFYEYFSSHWIVEIAMRFKKYTRHIAGEKISHTFFLFLLFLCVCFNAMSWWW